MHTIFCDFLIPFDRLFERASPFNSANLILEHGNAMSHSPFEEYRIEGITPKDYRTFDVLELKARGWTDAMMSEMLGGADHWESVNHYRNFTGKRTYYIPRVEAVEGTEEFVERFVKSVPRRRLDQTFIDDVLCRAMRLRDAGAASRWETLEAERRHAIEERNKAEAALRAKPTRR